MLRRHSQRLSLLSTPVIREAVLIPVVDFSKDAVGGGKYAGVCDVTITAFIAVYILGVNGAAVTVQDIGLVIPNSVGSVAALNDGAMGDVVLVR